MATASAAAAGAGDVPTKLELARSVEHRFAHICRRSQGTFSGRPTLQFPQSRRVSASQGILILHELDAEYIYIYYLYAIHSPAVNKNHMDASKSSYGFHVCKLEPATLLIGDPFALRPV